MAEICLIRLCDPSLDGSNAGLAARIAKLEAAVAQGIPVRASAPAEPAAPTAQAQSRQEEAPPWDDTMPPPPDDSDAPPMEGTPDIPAPAASAPKPAPPKKPVNTGEWPKLVTAMRGAVKMPAYSFLKKADSTVGIREGSILTIYCIEEFVYDIINKPEVLTAIADVASAQAGTAVEVKLHKGAPSGSTAGGTGAEAPAVKSKPVGSMADLKQFMQQHQS